MKYKPLGFEEKQDKTVDKNNLTSVFSYFPYIDIHLKT